MSRVGAPVARLERVPALDGLRGLAVVAVIAYHLDISWARGGFLGVDVFFVVSGYLITALLLLERDSSPSGSIDLRHFWLRRARRLLPALALLLVAVAAWGHLAAPPATLDRLRGDGLAAVAYVSNWRFIVTDQSYFETFLDPSPLQHLWSLGVEEQWYLLWPLAVVVLTRGVGRHRGALVATLAVGTVTSAALMAALYTPGDDVSRLYYGTDTRAQALLVGATLAAWRWWRPLPPSRPAPARLSLVAIVGLVAIVVAVIGTTGDRWLYRGGFLAIAVAAAAVVASASHRPSAMGRALSVAPLTWLGERSYGLYLWHWPVVVAMTVETTGLRGPSLLLIRLVLTLGLAAASFRFVELPIRTGRRPTVPVAGAGVAVGAIAVVLLATLATPTSARPEVATELRPVMVAPRRVALPASTTSTSSAALPVGDPLSVVPEVFEPPSTLAPPRPTPAPPRPTPAPPRPLQVLLVGDSQALVLGLGFRAGAAGPAVAVEGQAVLGCGVVPDALECAHWQDDWRAAVNTVQPDVVVMMIGAWEVLDHRIGGEWVRFGTDRWTDVVGASVLQAVDVASSSGAQVALLDVPCYQQAPFEFDGYDAQQRNEPDRVGALNALYRDVAQSRPGVHVIEYSQLVCPDGQYRAQVQGIDARPDGVHLSDAGAAMTWQWLGPQLRSLQP